MSISDLKIGERARICGYHKGRDGYRQKLLSMGLTSGAEFKLIRKAPLGDPIQIEVRDFCLTLRSAEAELLKIERYDS
ncbi:MAG: iron transporter FeoA [Gammaproteobacteria bacterium RIFOXYB2_FULL_38_6]|nr:MAG: iron transporter FeoA [Gammaproteobacteria bacterium RIFOXYB2_FULL_38_6]